ncbi:peptidylprolyl isomerase [Corynebacterium poyangense]|uniref:Peptidylprolyl isomerase n=1 Tax=Corynebacterium poyangense TaxID=2684405 RepID=A0A7H0SP47_9CORY|nr:peptidylprolyl isomerase [Corynebacterium poyangense]MBZ8177890.1 peptidylprolyl isomerase [Corynebacterium poyangense]QNQ90322.1 peptidylprolyl isomerase [Corynebacterium poyangense]
MSSNKQRGDAALKKLEKELHARDRAEKSGPVKVAVLALAAILVIAGGIWYLATRDSEESTTASDTETSSTPDTPDAPVLNLARSQPLPETVSCDYPDAEQAAREVSKPATKDVSARGTVKVNLDTNQGPIGMELDRSVAPCAVNAIEHLAKEKFFDNTVCHRLTTSGIFVLQCGDPTGKGTGGPGFRFANEYPATDTEGSQQTVTYPRGTIAMAHSQQKDSNGSQFFLNYQDSTLPPDYTYFGKIDDQGLATLDAIAAHGVQGGQTDGAPSEEVRIKTATVS